MLFQGRLDINRIPPNRDTIKEGLYPLSVTYHIIYDRRNMERLAPFFDYIKSKEGISIIDQGYISRMAQ